MIAWTRRRRRKRRARNRRRRARENTKKRLKVVTARVTPPMAAAVVIVTQIQTAMASSRAKRKKIPVGITALRASGESRVRKRPPLTEAGHRALAPNTSGLKRSREIIDKQGQRGERAGVVVLSQRTRSSRREVKRERDTTAGTERDLAALPWSEAGAAREAGRREGETGVTAEMLRGTEAAQMEGEAEQQMGGAEAGRGGRKGMAWGKAGVGREAKTEPKQGTDCLAVFLSYNIGQNMLNPLL